MNKKKLACIDESFTNIDPKELPYIFVTKFNDEATIAFYKLFLQMMADPKIKIIPIVISSYGGEVHSLLSMIDIIESSSKPVATISLGKAMSCGAMLMAFGSKGHRYCSPSTNVMLHEVSNSEYGKLTEIESGNRNTKKLNNDLFHRLAKKCGKKDRNFFMKEMKSRTNLDWFLTAVECKKLGLIDHVGVPSLIKG